MAMKVFRYRRLLLCLLFFNLTILFFAYYRNAIFRKPLKRPTSVSECMCTSKNTKRTHNFCYGDPLNVQSLGVKFDCEHLETLEQLNLVDYPGPFVNLSDAVKNEREVVFCSATSDDHMEQSLISYESFRKFNPTRKYIIYGLDLNSENTRKFQSMENVEFRVFDTTPYPNYVNNWKEYRFKPLILAEVLKEYPIIWWIDANANVNNATNMTSLMFNEIAEKRKEGSNSLPSSIIFFVSTLHSNFAVMFPELLEYFPFNSPNLLKTEQQLGASVILVTRTQFTLDIFKWWILCALDSTCMNPPGSQVYCSFGDNRWDTFGNCFRYDQSVMNLLLLNEFHEAQKFHSDLEYMFKRH